MTNHILCERIVDNGRYVVDCLSHVRIPITDPWSTYTYDSTESPFMNRIDSTLPYKMGSFADIDNGIIWMEVFVVDDLP